MPKLVVVICGNLQSGKNTLAGMIRDLLRDYSVREDSFAIGVKENCNEDFQSAANLINDVCDKIEQLCQDENEIFLDVLQQTRRLRLGGATWFENKTELSRILLQTYGTNIFRNRIDDEYWITQTMDIIRENKSDVVLITDGRFKNELRSLKSNFKTICIGIKKDNSDKNGTDHESEKDLKDYKEWNMFINNNGTFHELFQEATILTNYIKTLLK